MFTGIVESVGVVTSFVKKNSSCTLGIDSQNFTLNAQLGDSIAVNGVCLTATTISPKFFTADISQETLSLTSLKDLKIGSLVNLEQALTLQSRLGGHLVSGHVDFVATIIDIRIIDKMKRIFIKIHQNFMKYIVVKGSITVDGVSLTVNAINQDIIELMVIGHTLTNTIFQFYKIGFQVNIEVDLLAKYLENLINHQNQSTNNSSSPINETFLRQNGFL